MEESHIRRFYAGKTVLLTGCTGFVGTCVAEKLLRGCPELKKLYLLIRPKKGVSSEERKKKYFQLVNFDTLRELYPDFEDKVVTINGDLLKDNLGISPDDRELLIKTTDVIIHNAAAVMFYYKFSMSMKINVFATKLMLELGRDCDHLLAFVYVSTAYVHHYNRIVAEKFLPPPANLEIVQDLVKADDETIGLTKESLDTYIDKWGNTYAFSKAIAESIVEEFGMTSKFHCGVFRPSIVVSTFKEPIPAWVDNTNGPVSIVLAINLGLMHSSYLQDPVIDFVPADMTANALLAIIWDMVENKKTLGNTHLYNYGSSNVNPLYMRTLEEREATTAEEYPSIKCVWCFFFLYLRSKIVFYISHIFVHVIPAMLADLFLLVTGKKPIAMPILFKLQSNLELLFYFTNGDWRVKMNEMPRIWDTMNHADHQLFDSDIRKLDWFDYFANYWKGIRSYVLKESLDNLPVARRRYRRLKILHYTVLTLVCLLFAYYIYKIISYVFVN